MALSQGGEWFTKWTHVENGQVMVRRLHRLEVQGQDGHLYVLEGKELPDFIQTCSGTGHKGKHLAQILLNPANFPPPPRGEMKTWPNWRDVVHLALGMVFFLLLLRIVSTLAEAVH